MSLRKSSITLLTLCLLLLVVPTECTLSKSDRKKAAEKPKAVPKQQKPVVKEEGNIIEDRGEEIDESDMKARILAHYDELDVGERKSRTDVTLGYVTIWNNHGYDVAKWAANKFTHIAPVWFQLKPSQMDDQLSCRVDGTHDIDMGWIEEIQANNSAARIVPRLLFEGWNGEQLKQFLTEEQAQYRCVRMLTDFLRRHNFNGAVVEVWLQVMSATRGSAAQFLLEMVESWAEQFHASGLQFILPMSPPLNAELQPIGIASDEIIRRLLGAVDYLNLMTYDYPSPEISGVAPIGWVEANVRYVLQFAEGPGQAHKVLLGLNFYGYDRTGGRSDAILGNRFIELLQTDEDAELTFDAQAGEHRLSYGDQGVAYFPTLRSIQLRLELAEALGLGGVGIWDLGQGLNHFTSVL